MVFQIEFDIEKLSGIRQTNMAMTGFARGCGEVKWVDARSMTGPKEHAIQNSRDTPEMACVEKQSLYQNGTKTGRSYTAISYIKLFQLMDQDMHLFEILDYSKPSKAYWDVDSGARAAGKADLNECLLRIREEFPGARLHVSGSVSRGSYHIVASNLKICHSEMGLLRRFAVKNQGLGFDPVVYTRDRCFRLLGQSKAASRSSADHIKMDLSGSTMAEHAVQIGFDSVFEELIDELRDVPGPVTKRSTARNMHSRIGKDEDMVNEFGAGLMDWYYSESTWEGRLGAIPVEKVSRATRFEIMRYWKLNLGKSWVSFWDWCKTHGDTPVRMNSYLDLWVKAEHGVSGRLFEKIFKAGGYIEKTLTERFEETVLVPTVRTNGHYYSAWGLDTFKERVVVLTGQCGTGKSSAVAKSILKNGGRTLWITPRRSLADDTKTRLTKFGLTNVVSYLDTKERHTIAKYNTVVVSPNSLHKVFLDDSHVFDYVVLDEAMTILEDLCAVALHTTRAGSVRERNFEILTRHIKLAIKKVYFLDAYTTTAVLGLFDEKFIAVGTTPDPNKAMKLDVHRDAKRFVDSVEEDCLAGNKSYVFWSKASLSSKERLSQSIDGVNIETLSGEGMQIRLEKHGVVDGEGFKYYSASNDAGYWQDTRDVDTAWSVPELNLVMASSKISVGVSYDRKGVFKTVRAHFHPLLPVGTFFQSLCRIRNPVSKTIEVVKSGMRIPRGAIEIPRSNSDGLNRIIRAMELQLKANEYESEHLFTLYAKLSGYTTDTESKETTITEPIRVETDTIFNITFDSAAAFDWDTTDDPREKACEMLRDNAKKNLVASCFNSKQQQRWLNLVARFGHTQKKDLTALWDSNWDDVALKMQQIEFSSSVAARILEMAKLGPEGFSERVRQGVTNEELSDFYKSYIRRWRGSGVTVSECIRAVNLALGKEVIVKESEKKSRGGRDARKTYLNFSIAPEIKLCDA